MHGKLRCGWMPPHPTLFVRRECYEKYGYFDTDFKIAADYEIILRFLWKYKVSTFYIPEVLVKMRIGGTSNKNLRCILRKSKEDYKACRLYGLNGLLVVLMKNIRKLPQFFITPKK